MMFLRTSSIQERIGAGYSALQAASFARRTACWQGIAPRIPCACDARPQDGSKAIQRPGVTRHRAFFVGRGSRSWRLAEQTLGR